MNRRLAPVQLRLARGTRSVLIALGTLLALLCIHELGHVLAAWLTGASIAEIVIIDLRPHVRILGSANHAQQAFRAASGSGLALLAGFCFLLSSPVAGAGWRIARDAAAAFGCVELLGWCLSALSPSGSPAPDDTARFLAASGFGPGAILPVCLGVALAGVFVVRTAERRNQALPLTPSPIGDAGVRVKSAAAGR